MFSNRIAAGGKLAERLMQYKHGDAVVVGLPRGGVVTAKAVADRLQIPLIALVVKKIPHPYQSELAIGAVGPDKTVFYHEIAQSLSREEVEEQTEIAYKKQKEYEKKFTHHVQPLSNTTIILVDDGIATGSSVSAAIAYLRKQKVRQIIVAVPVAAIDTIMHIKPLVDDLIVLVTPMDFRAVGQFYEEFEQVNDEEVKKYLETCNR